MTRGRGYWVRLLWVSLWRSCSTKFVPSSEWSWPWQFGFVAVAFVGGTVIGVGLIFVVLFIRTPFKQRNEARREIERLIQATARAIDLEPEIIGAYERDEPLSDFPSERKIFAPFVIWNHGREDTFTVVLVSQSMGPAESVTEVYPRADIALKWQKPNDSGLDQPIPEHGSAKVDLAFLLPESQRVVFMCPGAGHQKWGPLGFKTDDYITGDIMFRAVGRPAWVRHRFRLSVGIAHPAGLTFDQVGSSVSIGGHQP